jgi:protein SEY1
MWENDIGRFHASNYGLLKIVFELNLQLFQKDNKNSKTLLFFLIRDTTGRTSLELLSGRIKNDIKTIWESIVKVNFFVKKA